MNAGAKGVKIICNGRLAGSEMARKETQKLGSIPLQTLDANVDYAIATSRTTYGAIGIKVWIYKGKFGEEIEPRQVRRRRPPRQTGGRGSVRVAPKTSRPPKKEQPKEQLKEQPTDADVIIAPKETDAPKPESKEESS
jgi:small subunit ribosomal protein S3